MKLLKKTYHIEAPIDVVWQSLVDPNEIEQWGGGPAQMDGREGTEFKLWGGDIYGTNKEVVTENRLVQKWYSGDWEEPSKVTFELKVDKDGTKVTLTHEDIPDEAYDEISKSWDEYYLGAIKRYLEAEV